MIYRDPPRFSLRVVIPPTDEPVTLEEAMEHLNIGLDDRHLDGWLNRNIPSARRWCEGWLGRTLAPQTLEISFGGHSQPTSVPTYWQPLSLNPWPDSSNVIELPMGPVASVEYITYRDAEGELQTLDAEGYELADDVLALASGSSWPTIQARRNAVQIRYIAGYTFPDDSPSICPLPPDLKTAILLKLQHLEGGSTDQRLEQAAKGFMEPSRLRLGMA